MHVRAKSGSLSPSIPSYRHHKPSGNAVVTLSGRDFYLGPWQSEKSRFEYERLVGEWLACGRCLPPGSGGITINELILRYWRHCESLYRKNGRPTSELACVRSAMGPLKLLYGTKLAAEFGPLALKVVRQQFIDGGLCRNTVNDYVSRIKRCFKWATENELVPSTVFHGLQAVSGLKRGRSDARETEAVRPVPEAFIEAVLPKLRPQVRALVKVQLLTGCRPGEVCAMRMCDIDISGHVWIFRPASFKTEHHGQIREIFIGPKAQEIIRPWFRPELDACLFQPKESEAARDAERRLKRQSRMTPSQARRKPVKNPKRVPRDHYTVDTYRRAIRRACEHLQIPVWHPHQLRHNAATRLRKDFGLELARIILGHTSAFTTEIYAEADHQQAVEVIAKIG